MTPKATSHVIQGMQKDTSKSKLGKEFAFDAKNIRITAREDNSLLTVTNEKGTVLKINLFGDYVGHCVINNQLVLFTSRGNTDFIFLYNSDFTQTVLYGGNLNLSVDNPIEAIGVYETENVQKVYWVDGRNQPRVINIAAKDDEINSWNDDSFNFVPSLDLKEEINTNIINTTSNFHSGVIQYAFTYYNKYGQESNIFYTTPLEHLTFNNRGGSPEDIIKDKAISIEIDNVDTKFEYLRVYAIHRTSINSIPTIRIVDDINIKKQASLHSYEDPNGNIVTLKYTITLVDIGEGESIDPSLLLYIGGEDIIADSLVEKDKSLFLSVKALNTPYLDETTKEKIKELFIPTNIVTPHDLKYPYFRRGEYYRLGVQLQYKNGKWSEPIPVGDIIGKYRPSYYTYDNSYYCGEFEISVSDYSIINDLKSKGYKKIRGITTIKNESDKTIIAQGIICPTVYNTDMRSNNSPYCLPSWYMRPCSSIDYNKEGNDIHNNPESKTVIEFRHNYSLISGGYIGAEIQSEIPQNEKYKVDQSIFTFHSPDVEFELNNMDHENVSMKIVGVVPITESFGDIRIQTKTASANTENTGIIAKKSSFIASGLFYRDRYPEDTGTLCDYLVYPWHRSGSLNFDNASTAETNGRTQYAVLDKKIISNYFKSSEIKWLFTKEKEEDNEFYFNRNYKGISSAKYASSEGSTLIKIPRKEYGENNEAIITNINYYSSVDILDTPEKSYFLYGKNTDKKDIESINSKYASKDPVRIKYKTSPHLVMALNNTKVDEKIVQPILPTLNGINKISKTTTSMASNEPKKYTRIVNIVKYGLGNYLLTSDGPTLAYFNNEYYYGVINGNTLNFPDTHPDVGTIVYYKNENKNLIDYFTCIKINSGKAIFSKTDSTPLYTIELTNNDGIQQEDISLTNSKDYLFLAELYKERDLNSPFIHLLDSDMNVWIPAGKGVKLDISNMVIDPNNPNNYIYLKIPYSYGDTFFNRYEVLKTYAYTPEDENQIVDVGSFMCESYVNLAGRYDKNIENIYNFYADKTNFNLLNTVYSQKDNFFNYRILDKDIVNRNKFINTITWSKEKHSGEEIDTWTNITMASTLDVDGTKGPINKLVVSNDKILCFQDRGISQILFNSRVQIPVSDGVPIEITNGYKVDGYRYISEIIGCQNKDSIVVTPSGVYFLDEESGGIYNLNEGLVNLSTQKGFDIWTKNAVKGGTFKSFYDKNNKDVYFVTDNDCLCYSEKLSEFTSFFDYIGVDTMFNVGSEFYSIKDNNVYKHFVGNYNNFYGEIKPYHLTIISNEDPQVDKVFTNIDYRADFFDSNNNYLENESFDTLEVWNEYQRGKETLRYSKFRPSNLKKKFRIWSANIPRDNKNKLDRMRNPWLHIKLSKNNPGTSKMELHDIVVKYLE